MSSGSASSVVGERSDCRICASGRLELAIDLGQQPWCNHFLAPEEIGQEPFYPLRVVHCQDCGTAQLDYTVPKETMFGDHTYLSGMTRSLSDHFRDIAREVDAGELADRSEKSVLDIGSNDGTQLRHFRDLGYDVLGVDPSVTAARIARENGIETVNEFFDLALARSLGRRFDVINAAGVFFHLEELHSVTEGIREALAPDGVFVVQFLYMKSIVENCAFDQIYHEHLLYYNLTTIDVLLRAHGLELFDAYLAPIHGGSMIAFVTHKARRDPSARLVKLMEGEVAGRCNDLATYRAFAERIVELRRENREYLEGVRASGRAAFGMGAPVKGNTLLNYFQIGPDHLQYLVEINELRRGLYSPGMHIPIAIERELERPPDVYYVLAWNFKDEILAKNQHLLDEGVEFYFPIDPSRGARP